jgi:hypothetical protein
MSKYFYRKLGRNADIKRHREKETELRCKIEECADDRFITAYKNLLNILLQSKANLVSTLGRKSHKGASDAN